MVGQLFIPRSCQGSYPPFLEWGRSIILVDPSTVGLPRPDIKVNCFQKKYREWLPQAQKDDIIILRKLKVRR